MSKAIAYAAASSAIALLAGCLGLNDVSRIDRPTQVPSPNRSLVVVGVGMEGAWGSPKFPIRLSEYDIERKSIIGNCWRWNKLEAATSEQIEYFFFDAAPGHYAGGGGHVVFRGQTSPLAFEVPAGRVVYLGNFIYAKDRKVDLRYDVSAAAEALSKSLPQTSSQVTVAKAVPVPTLQMFLCTP